MPKDEPPPSWSSDLGPLDTCIGELVTPELGKVAHDFHENLQLVDELQHMPYLAAADGVKLFYWTVHYVEAYNKPIVSILSGKVLAGEDLELWTSQSARSKSADRSLSEAMQSPDTHEDFATQIDDAIARLSRIEAFQRGLLTLQLVAVTQLWTAIECLARALWIAALNNAPTSRSMEAFHNMPPGELSDGLSSRTVSLATLGRHGFNLQGKIGDVLAPKFHFSSLNGISEAYVAAFSSRDSVTNLFDNSELVLLEQTRHTIVHNSAKVDEKFKVTTACAEEIGEQVPMNIATLVRLAKAVMSAGTSLIRFVDERVNLGEDENGS